ncbi:MAG TPA: single-stranded-DNA-specific exonuclease RecJ [Phycisphaerales bacterium]|nr:single-stranded-DNA-specific exonuclease RecJ [Phycisphaerales bacterium]
MQTVPESTSVSAEPDRHDGRGLTALWSRRIAPAAREDAAPGVHPLVARVLGARGLCGAEETAEFLRPSLTGLHDPSLLPGVDRGAERILRALRSGERIIIYGDYDVDGVTATAILWHTLMSLRPGADVRTYIPHRLDEGYGLNPEAIATLAAEGARVIVTVDCGITACESAAVAADRGVDLIITDHHNAPDCEDSLPRAYAAVHPRLPGSAYPFGDLCGAGVAYKLAWRLVTLAEGSARVSQRSRELLVSLLALAALGVIADVVPLRGENRVIARFGLGRLKHTPLAGLRALIDASGLGGEEIDAERVAFTLAPRLNACGRLGHAREAVRMLTTCSYEEAHAIAEELNRQNAARRKIEDEIVEQASELAEAAGMTGPGRRAIVLAHREWHAGVVGIACSRLVERFHRPVVLMADDGEVCHGSGRSVPGVSLHAALARCAHLLERWGGHDMAAGLAVRREHLECLQEALVAEVNAVLHEASLARRISYDCDAQLAELAIEPVRELERLGPFGMGNPQVRLRLNALAIADQPRAVGKEGKHLSMRVRSGDRSLKLIAWRWGERAGELAPGMRIDAIVTPKLSDWGGSTSVEAELHDLRVHRT